MKPVSTLPELSLRLDGLMLEPSRATGLAELNVRQRLSAPALCEVVFEDPPGPLPDLSTIVPGTALSLSVAGAAVPLFSGEVTAVEQDYRPGGLRRLRIRAYDPIHRLRKRRSIRTHVKVTARSLAEELVADLGLEVDAEAAGPAWEMLVQDRQSDLELLVEVLERSGLYYAVREGTLHLLTLAGIGAGPDVELELGDTLLEAVLEMNADPATRSVSVSGWNALTGQAHASEAGDPRTAEPRLDDADPARFGADGKLFLPNEGLADDDQAAGIAAAELDRRCAGEVVIEGVAQGDPSLRPGTVVKIRGAGEAVADRFALTAVDHIVDVRGGFVSRLSSRVPAPHERPRTPSVTLGTVSRVDDPESRGRVKVRLPALGDLESDWLEVVALAAGAGKGMVAIPDTGDTVLVLLPFQDAASGLVLGGLYGPGGAPIAGGVEGGAVRAFALMTAGGLRLTLDDAKGRVRLEDGSGSYLELTPERVTVHSVPDLDISAPGKRIRIRGAAVDFETA